MGLRFFNADGSSLTDEARVNQSTIFSQNNPQTTTLQNGDVLVIWRSDISNSDVPDYSIFARVFSSEGAPKTGEFLVPSSTAGDQTFAALAATPDGGFVAIWIDDFTRSDPSGRVELRFQRFNAEGEKVGAVSAIPPSGASFDRAPDVFVDKDWNLYLTWNGVTDNPRSGATYLTTATLQQRASQESDVLAGTDGEDVIFGLGGNDQIVLGAGDDFLDGGDGVDTATFEGEQSNYTLTISSDVTIVTDRGVSGDGTNRLISVEFLEFGTQIPLFGDAHINLDNFDDANGLAAEQFAEITELYIAYFNRAPDAIGLNFWASAFARGEVDLTGMAELFFDQVETRSVYASALSEDGSQIIDVTAFVTEIFTNVLGRTPDERGLDFWVGVLGRGEVTTGSAISSIIEGAKADAPADASLAEIEARALDQQYLSNATDVGVHFAVINGMSDTADANAVMNLLTRSSDSISAAVE